MAWYELFSFQELSRVMKNLFFENILQRNFISQWETIHLALEFTEFRLFEWCVRLHCDRMCLYFFILCIFLHFSFLHFTAEASGDYPVLGDSAEVSRRGGEKSTTFPKGHQKSGQAVNEALSVCLVFFSSSTSSFGSSSSGAPRGTLALCVRSPFQSPLWRSVPPFNWLWSLTTHWVAPSVSFLYYTRPVSVHTCVSHMQNGKMANRAISLFLVQKEALWESGLTHEPLTWHRRAPSKPSYASWFINII